MVTVEYEDNKPKRIETILISTQHTADVSAEDVKKAVIEKVINAVVPSDMIDENTKIYINPTGRFVIGGPLGDTGLTGRKIASENAQKLEVEWEKLSTDMEAIADTVEELFLEKMQVKLIDQQHIC